ncbi:ATP-binding cassette domain-containing protein [Pseudonocardia kujensis]|uniref:oligopeptide/dipeptide ABC transporter ATP-binding protein n=1 Tax=Pseudonocardia kujensis TaxID=1128675 RepID=UPI001E47ABB3|nr:oligopeptide/dipeptide ABC transporter ATP-binding protein [Pseudonocardia kujensis]MCE0764550.1 ATP-binding cassette domain-containing protein [Pseudonocardia kujensis]
MTALEPAGAATALHYPIVDIRGLTKHFRVGRPRRDLVALDGVDLAVEAGQTTALVGESGSGKSTLARCLVGLLPVTAGEVLLDGIDLAGLGSVALSRTYRDIQMVFQDPHSSLNPRRSVYQAVTEPLRLHLGLDRAAQRARARELMSLVGLEDQHLERMPHELSGGQRQRVGIARAIAVGPKVVVLDEPTSSLDVSVRGQILDLLLGLQQRLGMTYLFISHDLQAVRRVADRVCVMYLGSIVEDGPADEVLDRPRHPYTRALMSAAPVAEYGVRRERLRLAGEIPSPVDLPAECRLAGRCPYVRDSCRTAVPPLVTVEGTHRSACPVPLPS